MSSELPIIVISLGAQGGSLLYRIGKRLSNAHLKAHFIFICGRNEKTKEKLSKIKFAEKSVATGYVTDVGRYLSIADYFVGKAGTGSIAEALFMQLPCFIINSGFVMEQEQGNIDLIRSMKIGDCFDRPDELIARLKRDLGRCTKTLYPNLEKFRDNNGLEVAVQSIRRFIK